MNLLTYTVNMIFKNIVTEFNAVSVTLLSFFSWKEQKEVYK